MVILEAFFCLIPVMGTGTLQISKDSASGAVNQTANSLSVFHSFILAYFVLFKGFVTDGEFNSLRTMGSERPISILQLISDARQKAKSTSVTKIAKYLRLNAQGISYSILYWVAVCIFFDRT